MSDPIKEYTKWNSALWNYFFPTRQENPVLYLDETVLAQVAEENKFEKTEGKSWEQQFLSSALLSNYAFNEFKRNWGLHTGEHYSKVQQATTWEKLVESLMSRKLKEHPAYFGMLCAVMLLASIREPDHSAIKEEAQKYLGGDYSKKPGELVDPLLHQLHTDRPSFDSDRMICGKQKNISRIKYHLVLKKKERDDFIDFLEIYNLQWKYEPYSFFINNILVPALENAGKTELARKITKEENIPYFKSILCSDLNYGKKDSICGNVVQEKTITWYYELCFDFDGSHYFNILCDYSPVPLSFKDGVFSVEDVSSSSDSIAIGVPLKQIQNKKVENDGIVYSICNICDYSKDSYSRLYFEHISNNVYRQVERPKKEKKYYVFIEKSKTLKKYEKTWKKDDEIQESGYDVYFVSDFALPEKESSNRLIVEDRFHLYGLGSWFSIFIPDNYSLLWKPNLLKVEKEELQIKPLKGKDGKSYFRLPPTTSNHLSGDLLVRDEKGNDVWSDQIFCNFEWKETQTIFHMNGWGEITSEQINNGNIQNIISGRQILQNGLEKKSEGSDILLQILHDLADSSGCLTSNALTAAIKFAFQFYGINPTRKKTNDNVYSVIYALRKLGYVLAYYNVDRKGYQNQLLSKYVERSNYSLNGATNAYVVKGVYNQEDINSLLSGSGTKQIFRRRPYNPKALDSYPEFICLPDVILFDGKPNDQWMIQDFPTADYLISNMADMKGFADKFGIKTRGEKFQDVRQITNVPCMVKIKNKNVLCTQEQGHYWTHTYYEADGQLRYIPQDLSRVYCQNARNTPACLMEWSKTMRSVNYAKLSFVTGMGVPELLEVALCDLTLGMPNMESVFIVNQEEDLGIRIEKNTGCSVKQCYLTTATSTNNLYLKEAIKKLSGRDIDDFERSSSIYLYRVKKEYILKCDENDAAKPQLVSLFYDKDLLAFALGKDVYCRKPSSENFYKVDGKDLNLLFSKIICKSTVTINEKERYLKPLPKHSDNCLVIKVLEKQIVK